ncbi:unnamed protein product, partial [marine sediment metagenome]
ADNFKFIIAEFDNVHTFKDKRGNDMAFLDLIDINGSTMQALIFSSDFDAKKINQNDLYLVQGRIDNRFILTYYKSIDQFNIKK